MCDAHPTAPDESEEEAETTADSEDADGRGAERVQPRESDDGLERSVHTQKRTPAYLRPEAPTRKSARHAI